MIPILFEYDATTFTSHGLGDLIDCINCEVAQTEEGEYELALDYPMGSPMFGELTINRIVLAKANPYDNPQAFRIYGYEKQLNGVMRVNCQHISYDITNIPVKAFKDKTTASSALSTMYSNAVMSCPFTFTTTIPSSTAPHTRDGKFKIETPDRMRTILLDGDSSIRGSFGGDLVFDNFSIALKETGGEDRGVLIEYGVDLVDMNQEENISEMITGVYPYFRYTLDDEDYTDAIQYGTIQYATGTFQKHNIQPLDLTEYYPDQEEHTHPTQSQLNQKAQEWITAEKIGEPAINITLTPAALGQDIRLYDSVTVRFVKMGINDIKAKVTSYKYDVLKERYNEVEIGYAKPSILFSLEDASHLKRGLLPPERIKDKSITSDKYSDGSVGSSAVAEDTISSYHLVDSAVTSSKLAENSVTESAIKTDAVTSSKIKDKAVASEKLAKDAVTEEKISASAVTSGKIATSAVASEKIAKDAVTSEKIQDSAVVTSKINDSAVVSGKINNGAVITDKIGSGAVTSGKIASGAVTEDKIANYAVSVNKIENGAVTNYKLDDGAVSENKILDYAVSYAKLDSDSVDEDKFTWSMQVTWSDILSTNALFAGYVYSAGVIQCNSIVVGSTMHQTRTVYVRNAAGTGSVSITGVFEII